MLLGNIITEELKNRIQTFFNNRIYSTLKPNKDYTLKEETLTGSPVKPLNMNHKQNITKM
jgi:hypothetical protein